MARLAGSVHGVVVQITTPALFASKSAASTPKAFAIAAVSATGNLTSMAGETLSLYSTSASANAEPQSVHQ